MADLTPFSVVLDKRALKELERLPLHVQRRYYNKVKPELEKDPIAPRVNLDVKIIEVRGTAVYICVRVGDWRLAGRVDREERTVRGLYWY